MLSQERFNVGGYSLTLNLNEHWKKTLKSGLSCAKLSLKALQPDGTIFGLETTHIDLKHMLNSGKELL